MLGSKARAARIKAIVSRANEWVGYINNLNQNATRTPGDPYERQWTFADSVVPMLLPKSYKYLGAGASRTAVLAGGHVYKVSIGSQWQNENEAAAYLALKHITHPKVRIAETYALVPGVNVAEYVKGRDNDDHEAIRDFSRVVEREGRWWSSDTWGDNVLMDENGMVVVVDLGCFSPKPADA